MSPLNPIKNMFVDGLPVKTIHLSVSSPNQLYSKSN